MSAVCLGVADAAAADISLLYPVPAVIDLRSGEAKTLNVALQWDPGPGWKLYQRRASLELTLTIDATVTSPWSAPLKDAGFDLPSLSRPPMRPRCGGWSGSWATGGCCLP